MKTLKKAKSIHSFVFLNMLLLLTINLGYSQNTSNKTSAYSLDFVNGISLPMGDLKNHADNGFNSTFTIHKNFCDKVSVGLSTNYTSLPIKNNTNVSNERWNSTSINIGPKYKMGNSKFSVDLYGKLGLSFISVPEIQNFYPNTEASTSYFEETNTSSLNTQLGVNIEMEICKGLFMYIAPEYTSNLNGNIHYGKRDLSKAVDATGNFNQDVADNIPFNNHSLLLSTFNINFGIRIDLKGSNHNAKATSHNASRSNRSNNVASPNDDNDINNSTRATEATDYNSSRSNKADGVNNTDVNNEDTAKATSHNASRSNRSNNVASPNDGNDINNSTRATEATDYNSSRSNKADGVNNTDDNNEDTAKATSHNASRSNRSNNVASPNNGNDINNSTRATEATDYNSSRSNKADGVNNTDDNNEDTAKATSHNASRSNRSNNIASPNDGNDINNSTRATEATDYNSSRSNKADGASQNDTDYNSSRSNKATSDNIVE